MGLREFKLPDVGEGLTEADILKWHVVEGQSLELNQILCEIETEKAVVELPSPYEGTVSRILVSEGATVPVGTPILSVETAELDDVEPAPSAKTPVLVGYGVADTDNARRHRRRKGSTPAPATTTPTSVVAASPQMSPRTTPPIRLLARQRGVNLDTLEGTGRFGLITRDDVERASGSSAGLPTLRGDERVALSALARTMVESMTLSKSTIPHATVWVKTDATATMSLVAGLKKRPSLEGIKISPLLVIAMACLEAIKSFPLLNASYTAGEREVVVHHDVNLGVAAASPRGLLVPSVKNAHAMDVISLAKDLQLLVDEARSGKATPERLSGTTFTITNVGPFGVDAAAAIIPPGTSAILAVGQIAPAPWVEEGELVVRDVVELSLAFDHRVVDGAMASGFIRLVADILNDPAPYLLAH